MPSSSPQPSPWTFVLAGVLFVACSLVLHGLIGTLDDSLSYRSGDELSPDEVENVRKMTSPFMALQPSRHKELLQKRSEQFKEAAMHGVGEKNLRQIQEVIHHKPKEPQKKSFQGKNPLQVYQETHALTAPQIEEIVRTTLRVDKSPETKMQPTDAHFYDINDCPSQIPKGYPIHWSAKDNVLKDWNPDWVSSVPDQIYQSLCRFDWKRPEHQELAEQYRQAELPFVIINHIDLWNTTERWSHPDYLRQWLPADGEKFRTEHSHNNHMMYWKLRKKKTPTGWEAPTENVDLTYDEWYKHATDLEEKAKQTKESSPGDVLTDHELYHKKDPIVDAEHYYFRLNGDFTSKNEFLFDELPMFRPTKKNLFMVQPAQARGINCRFGSKGIIAETHYDFSRNFIFILHGRKRYVLSHPKQCPNMELYPEGHPSARHSKIDWSKPSDWEVGNFPKAMVNEVVLEAGDALYLPTAWFHFIVSLDLNYQCNARSGISRENVEHIKQCGFSA